MDRRAFITMLGGSTLAAPIAAKAQQADKVYRIGLVTLGAAPTRHGLWQRLLAALREMNYVEGQNLVVRLALAEGKPERLPGLVAELMQARWMSLSPPLLKKLWRRRKQPRQSPLS